MVALTIGMPTYKDFDGVYFTLQALRLYQDLEDTELLVVDNYGCDHTRDLVEGWVHGRYIRATDIVGTAAAKNLVLQEARGGAVLCCDSHVLLNPGVVARLKAYYRDHPNTIDLLQGPLVYDDLLSISTHFEPVWRGEMWGTWATDPRGEDPEAEPFDIPMQGMGAFSCRTSAWRGFHPLFRGFGGEEGYIHEKFRQAGARTLCLPWFRWTHRFGRPDGTPYPLTVEEKLRNYVIGHVDLGLDYMEPVNHFSEVFGAEKAMAIAAAAIAELAENGYASAGVAEARTAAARTRKGKKSKKVKKGKGKSKTFVGVELTRELRVDNGSADPTWTDTHPEREPLVPAALSITSTNAVASAPRRAIVCFVEDNRHLIQQLLALRQSWLYSEATDTDLVVMGPAEALARLPEDLVKIEQRPVADDPVWRDYRYVNGVACLNGAGSERLDRYDYILRTDADAFITPSWNDFRRAFFTYGSGGYANDGDVRQRIRDIAQEFGLAHHGMTDIGEAWYGPTGLVRQVAGLTELLTKRLLTREFADDEGAWPGWYRGVALRYAAEIAINHLTPDAEPSALLDAWSTSEGPTASVAHIHCIHTDEKFSKHWFMDDRYTSADAENLDLDIVRDYCMEMSLQSIESTGAVNVGERLLVASTNERRKNP